MNKTTTRDVSSMQALRGSQGESVGLEEVYDRQAEVYDALRYESREGKFFDLLEGQILCDVLSPIQGKKVLDIPAGTGRSSLPMARAGADVLSADIAAQMLAQAEAKAQEEGLSNIRFQKASAFELPFEDSSFDVVTSFKFFHLLEEEDKLKALSEMKRVLKPGGTLVAEFNSPFYGGIIAYYRCTFRKKRSGLIRMKCLFPSQMKGYFEGLTVRKIVGVKTPFAGQMSRITGQRAMLWMNHRIGRIPVIRQLCYGLMVVAEKPAGRE